MQRLGVIFWGSLLLWLLVWLNLSGSEYSNTPVQIDQNEMAFLDLNTGFPDQQQNHFYNEGESEFQEVYLFDFDPNSIGKNEWIDLGFSEKQADAILNYKAKVGRFNRKEDLKNIFVISEKKYAELEPYIQISSQSISEETINLISLNSATKEDLVSLPGIGDFFADRIIKYRNSLGGFTSMTQVHEVYGMKEDMYQVLVENTSIELESHRRIKINVASKDEIDKHPYIDFDVTAAILKERELGKIESLNFLMEKNLLSQEEIDRLIPYIDFE